MKYHRKDNPPLKSLRLEKEMGTAASSLIYVSGTVSGHADAFYGTGMVALFISPEREAI